MCVCDAVTRSCTSIYYSLSKHSSTSLTSSVNSLSFYFRELSTTRRLDIISSGCSGNVDTHKHTKCWRRIKYLYPVSPPDNTFALPTEVFSSCLAIVSAVTVGGLFLWPALRYETGYQTVWETRPSAETPSNVHWRRFYFKLTCVHSALELSGRCALQIYLLHFSIPLSADRRRVSYDGCLEVRGKIIRTAEWRSEWMERNGMHGWMDIIFYYSWSSWFLIVIIIIKNN